jgi:hypothetical protein
VQSPSTNIFCVLPFLSYSHVGLPLSITSHLLRRFHQLTIWTLHRWTRVSIVFYLRKTTVIQSFLTSCTEKVLPLILMHRVRRSSTAETFSKTFSNPITRLRAARESISTSPLLTTDSILSTVTARYVLSSSCSQLLSARLSSLLCL